MFEKANIPETVTKKSKKSKKMEKVDKCPLCMEKLEIDDQNFLPCCCGYQICLFCWHRIKNEGDEKCPLCRRTYSEMPAKFEPTSAELVLKQKNKKKHEDNKKKQKLAEDRKQLADVRVVRKNLIFVNELPLSITKDQKQYQRFVNIFKQAGTLKKCTVINTSKNYAGQKATFARAYLTYLKNEEALKALKMFENLEFEGRELKLSLGTTKYCSNYIKNVNCTNKECVYLHEQAENEASFTKEQIHAGKHIEYGQRLYDQYISNIHSRSVSNSVSEEKKSEPQAQHSEDLEKEVFPDISISASTSQQNGQLQNERNFSPEAEKVEESKTIKILTEYLTDASLHKNSLGNLLSSLSQSEKEQIMKLISIDSPVNNTTNSSGELGQLFQTKITDAGEEKFVFKRVPPVIPNGTPFYEDQFSTNECLLTRTTNSLKETSSSFPFKKQDLSPLNLCNPDLPETPDSKLESKDDCGLDFDPVKFALGGLDDLVVSEKQKARKDGKSLNLFSVNTVKKTSNQIARVQQPVNLYPSATANPVNNYFPSNAYSSRSQNSPVVDFYNQTSFRPSVQNNASVGRSSLHPQTLSTLSQRNQVPNLGGNALTIQLPRYSGMSVGNSSMVNGFSPQQYLSQMSPHEFMLPQQQNPSFENYTQSQFSNFEPIQPSQAYSVNTLQSQNMREFGGNLSLGPRVSRSDPLSRNQTLHLQQHQRFNSFINSTPQGGNLPYNH